MLFRSLLSSQNASTSNRLNLFLCDSGEEPGLDDDRLLREHSLAQNLEDSSPGAVDDRGLVLDGGVLGPSLLRDQRPQLVEVDGGTAVVGDVGVDVEVPHTNLPEVSRMVLVKVDPVVMLSTSVTTTSGVLAVLPNPSMTMGNMTPQLPGLLLISRHLPFSCRSE